jgi:hypothetical protein
MLLTYFRVWVFPACIPEAVEILNSIEGSLEDVLMSVGKFDNNVVVPNSQVLTWWSLKWLPLHFPPDFSKSSPST